MTAPGRPKVAVVVRKYGTVGGGERFAFELTDRLARDGRYEIHVFANRWIPGRGPVVFHRIPRVPFPRFLRQAIFARLAGREVEKGGFDLVHTHDRIFRADIFTMHSIPHETWVRDIRKRRRTLFDRVTAWVERRLMEDGGCAWHLPVSSITGEAYRAKYRIDPSRMRVLHPGVDPGQFSAPDRSACRAAIRGKHGIGSSEVVILFVGMNFEVKGLDAVIRAVATAKTMRADAAIRLLVVGKGNVGKYRSLAASLGIGGEVIFSGPVGKGVEDYYLASDIFIMLSKFDTFGMVVLEAMAARLPVILSANVGAKDLVEEGLNGFVLPDGRDVDAAAEKVLLLLDENRRSAMGEAGFRTASAHTWEHLAAKVTEIYESSLPRPARNGRES